MYDICIYFICYICYVPVLLHVFCVMCEYIEFVFSCLIKKMLPTFLCPSLMTRYDFLEAWNVIVSNFRTDLI